MFIIVHIGCLAAGLDVNWPPLFLAQGLFILGYSASQHCKGLAIFVEAQLVGRCCGSNLALRSIHSSSYLIFTLYIFTRRANYGRTSQSAGIKSPGHTLQVGFRKNFYVYLFTDFANFSFQSHLRSNNGNRRQPLASIKILVQHRPEWISEWRLTDTRNKAIVWLAKSTVIATTVSKWLSVTWNNSGWLVLH